MPIRSASPIGSTEELHELGLDPGEWGSCSARDQNRNIGCDSYEICPWRGPRPMIKGYQIIKATPNGVIARNGFADCWVCLRLKENAELNKNVFRFIGESGDRIELSAMVRRARNPQKPLETTSEWETDTVTIPWFPLAKDRPELYQARALAEGRRSAEAAERQRREAEMLGLKERVEGYETVRADGSQGRSEGVVPELGDRPGKKAKA